MFTINKCKDKAVYSAKLKKHSTLNLKRIAKKFETIKKTPIVLLIKIEDYEVIVHKHGELLFKNCENKKIIEKIAKKIYNQNIN